MSTLCPYCQTVGDLTGTLYQHTRDTKIYINTAANARTIVTEARGCPKNADCALMNIPVRAVFIINFCPHCGRDLRIHNIN